MNLYNYYRQVALDTGNTDHVDMNTDTVKIALMEGYTYAASHKYISDILSSGGTIVARSTALASPTVVNGTFDAADKTLTAVTTGHTVTSIIVYKDSGADGSSTVIAHIDQNGSGGALSQATNGSDITVTFDAAGIFDI